MENHRRQQVIGDPHAPFATTLAQQCGSANDYRAVGSPSLPNYIGATAGTTHGIRDDRDPSVHALLTDNLFRQVRRAGGAARSYVEAMPAPCTLQSTGRYAVKHNPAAYFVGDDDRRACETDDLPMGTANAGALVQDLARQSLPRFSFVIPDTCNDTHDCAVAVGDAWLGDWVPRITGSPAYRAGSTALFIVWDEPTPMPFIAIAPSIPAGTRTTTTVDHYALLRTTEELLGLPPIGAAGAAPSMRAVLHI